MTRDLKFSRKTASSIGEAIADSKMISRGDRITVGLSGGKDSVLLAAALAGLTKRSPVPFTVDACMIDITGGKTDTAPVRTLCEEIGIDLEIISRPVLDIIASRKEPSPCSFCSNMRGGILFRRAAEKGSTTVAMGHNLDDAVETALLNLFFAGRFDCFAPKSWRSRSGLWLIRPLVYIQEKDIEKEVQRLDLPTISPMCPFPRESRRERMKKLVGILEEEIPDIRSQVLHALKGSPRWKEFSQKMQ
ncbi:MAG TPA: ATP-binding protein [Synergistales bacterium]|nr:ATP-binding protein [Synergistales bacterium]HRX27733.1 ATP-binding protein [Aminivibrio sp.]